LLAEARRARRLVQWYNNTNSLVSIQASAQAQNTYCISLTHNHFHDGHFLLALVAAQSLIADNEFDHFADDAINPAGSNISILRNFIHDPVNLTQVSPIAVTAISATGVFSASNAYKAGEAVQFAGPLPATGLTYADHFYILPGVTPTTFQVGATPGGTAIIPTGFATGLVASGPPSGTPLVYAHVDDIQWYSAPHASGRTILHWHDDVIDSNLVIDRYDPLNPWPTPSNGINDYTGDSNLWFGPNIKITNNWMLVGGLQAILFDAVGDGTSIIAGNTVDDDGTGVGSGSVPEIAPASGFRACNNIAPIIAVNTNHGATFDHNLATAEIVYFVQNPDGTYQTNGSFFAGLGWYGPTGRVTAPDASHTNAVIEYKHAAQARLFTSLAFNANGTAVVGQMPDLSLIPGGRAATIGTLGCGTSTNAFGQTPAGVAALRRRGREGNTDGPKFPR
jgi:hypothetical protein